MADQEIQYKPPVMTSDGRALWPIDPDTGVPTPKSVVIQSDADGLKNNLDWGNRASEWATRHIAFASNRYTDYVLTSGFSSVCVAKVRSDYKSATENMTDRIAKMRVRAKGAMRYGCGNCNEMSSTSFIWLLDYYLLFNNDPTLAWMEVTNGDHLFVLIGFPKNKSSTTAEWGPRSVVVDPWNNAVYPGLEIRKRRWNSSGEVYTPIVELPVKRHIEPWRR